MTIKDVQEITGLTARTIRWYIEQGLLSPAYTGAAKRTAEYSDKDLAQLNIIIILTECGMELKEIKDLIDKGSLYELETLDSAIKRLEKKKTDIEGMINVVKLTKIYGGNEFIEPYFAGLPMSAFQNGGTMVESIKKSKEYVHQAKEEQFDITDPKEEPFLMLGSAIGLLSLRYLIDKPESEATQKLLTRMYDYTRQNKAAFEDAFDSENEFAESLPEMLEDSEIELSEAIRRSWGDEALSFLKKAISIYRIRTSPNSL